MADNLTLNVGAGGSTLATDDVVGIHYQRVKLVDGTLDSTTAIASGGGVEAGALRVTLASDSTGVVSVDDNGASLTVDGTVTADTELPAAAALADNTANPTAPAVGSFPHWYDGATWDRALGDSTNGLLVNLGANNDVTVTGTVTVGSHAVTNAGTFAVQVDGAALTSLQLLDDVIVADDAAFTPATTKVAMAGFEYDDTLPDSVDEGDAGAARMSANRNQYVQLRDGSGSERGAAVNASNQLSVSVDNTVTVGSHAVTNAGTFAVQATVAAGATNIAKAEDVASADADVGVPAMAVRKATPANTSGTDGDYEMLQMSAGRLWTSTTVDAALPAGTNAIGKLAANSGVTIGAVEIAAAQTLATVTTVSTVTTCSTLTGGGVAHDGADSGNPVKIGVKAETSPKGITPVADGDRTDLYADSDGMLMVKLNTSGADLISERVTDTGGSSTAFSNFGAVASTYNYVTAISVFNSSATAGYVDFRDGTAGSVKYTVALPAGGGAVLASPMPLFKTSANTALAYDVSAALTTVYISITGFQSKV